MYLHSNICHLLHDKRSPDCYGLAKKIALQMSLLIKDDSLRCINSGLPSYTYKQLKSKLVEYVH